MHPKLNDDFILHPIQTFKTICTLYKYYAAIKRTWLFPVNFLTDVLDKRVTCVFFKDNFIKTQTETNEQMTTIIFVI